MSETRKHYLFFKNNEDEQNFNELIEKGLFPLLEVKSRGMQRKYKYKLYCPMENTYSGKLYSGDVYEKRQSYAINGDLGQYSNNLEVVRIIRGVKKEKVKITISKYYLEKENDENKEYLKSIANRIY